MFHSKSVTLSFLTPVRPEVESTEGSITVNVLDRYMYGYGSLSLEDRRRLDDFLTMWEETRDGYWSPYSLIVGGDLVRDLFYLLKLTELFSSKNDFDPSTLLTRHWPSVLCVYTPSVRVQMMCIISKDDFYRRLSTTLYLRFLSFRDPFTSFTGIEPETRSPNPWDFLSNRDSSFVVRNSKIKKSTNRVNSDFEYTSELFL